MQEKEKISSLESTLNNITVKLYYQNEEYYLLLKKQHSGQFNLLFVTDYCNFWVKKINYDYLTQLKDELKIRTSTKVFIDHLAYGIKQNCKILQINPYLLLVIKLKISDGLVMSCTIKLHIHINIDDKHSNFISLLKLFGGQLYDAKDLQNRQEKAKDVKKYQSKLKQSKEDNVAHNKLFPKPENRVIPEKYRDLINPYKKKRKMEGVKIGVPQEQGSDNV